MTPRRFSPQAFALAHRLTLQDHLWERPQVEGITIDGPDSRDLDDAIWIEPTDTGAILSIHIADVSELVTIGSILDKEAIARTQTRYFRNGNAPMLPRSLSEDKLSLWDYQDRPTLTIQITLNHKAEIEQTEIYETWLRSRRKFHYQEVAQEQKDPNSPFSELLQTAHTWAEQLFRSRLNTGAIGATLTAQGNWLTEEGSIIQGKRHSSHLLIQEFMILANRAVAQWLAERDIPALYRNHTARAIAPDRETMYQTMLSLGTAEAIRQRLSSWLNRATYSPTLIGHFALALPAYTHFTSPIRRLADLINHRIVKAILRNQDSPYSKTELEQLGQHIAQVTLEIEETTSDYFKAIHQKVYQSQLETPAALGHLSAKAFSRVLKYGIENNGLTEITQELTKRLESGILQVQDLYLLLFQSDQEELKELAYAHLKENVQDAASVIAIARAQETDWEGIEYVEQQHGQTLPFHVWLVVNINGEQLTTAQPAEHHQKQPAKHRACLMWLEGYLRGTLVPPEQRVQPKPPQQDQSKDNPPETNASREKRSHPILAKQLKDGQMFVSLLMELCQGFQWQSPAFEIRAGGDSFICECRLEAMNEIFVGEATATKKQRAKHLAARVVLEQLQARAGAEVNA